MVFPLLEDKKVNLRLMEKEDIPLQVEWYNNMEFQGIYNTSPQKSRTEWEREFDNPSPIKIAMD
jgi:hypothetical protein